MGFRHTTNSGVSHRPPTPPTAARSHPYSVLAGQESGLSTRHANDAMIAMGNEAIFTWVFGVAAS